MMDYRDLPPFHFFLTVLRHQPDVAHFYCKIWSGKDNLNSLIVDKKTIYSQYLVTPATFKRKLHYLLEEGLLSIEESPYFYEIDFVNYEEEEDPLPEPAAKKKGKSNDTTDKLTPIS